MDDNTSLDSQDIALVELLQQNARMPIAEIARALDVSRPTASKRLDRLVDSGALHLLAETDIYAAGKRELVVLGIRVEGRAVTEVAEQLAAYEQTIAVSTVAGRYDIEVLLVTESQQELTQLLTEEIPSIDGVSDRAASLCLQVLKFESNRVPFLS